MATILMFDGFEAYNSTADFGTGGKWSAGASAAQLSFGAAGAYGVGAKALTFASDDSTGNQRMVLTTTLPSGVTKLSIGIRFKISAVNRQIITLFDNVGAFIACLYVNGAGLLSVTKTQTGGSFNATAMAIGTHAAIGLNAWNHVELEYNFAASGNIVAKLNGVSVLTFAGDTTNARATLRAVGWNSQYTGSQGAYWPLAGTLVDDLYIADWTSDPSAPGYGDLMVQTWSPDSTAANAWTVVGASAHVAVQSNDGDTTYIESATNGQQVFLDSSTVFHNTPAVIRAVGITANARKTDAAARNMKLDVKSGASVGQSGAIALADAYGTYQSVFATDPATGAAWTPTAALAAQFGAEPV